ncbi:MAG: C10 family peptidase [Paludibacteraceae bacterium]|nr:C10 family peptidase [Paludibacteraceae bacterium]
MKKFYYCFIALAMSTTMTAAQRSVNEAAEIAAQFTNMQSQLAGMHRVPRKPVDMQFVYEVPKPHSDEAALYVFNQTSDNGFVIVSADDNAVTILGYADRGSFDVNNLPANLRNWLNYYAERVAVAQPAKSGAKKALKPSSTTPIAPLLGEIEWNQDMPYNALCPVDQLDNTRSASGCIATAAAQIMRYWKWPKQGSGSHSYTWHNCIDYDDNGDCHQYYDTILSADFGATTYDWDNMPANGDFGYNSTQVKAIAQLLYHVGVSCEMGYGGNEAGGSGASMVDIANAMEEYFGYTAEYYIVRDDETDYPTISNIAETFTTELQAGRPILMAGCNDEGCHAFVCDGMDAQGLFHINWGWGGLCNGFFALSALDPEEQGIGGSESGDGYSQYLHYVTGLEPDRKPIAVTGITMTTDQVTMRLEELYQFTAQVQPDSATNRGYTWTSSDEDIVSIDASGLAEALSPGTVTITATTVEGDYSASCEVTVLDEPLFAIKLFVNYMYATKEKEYGRWTIDAMNYEEDGDNVPYIRFFINSHSETKIAGTYDLSSYPGAAVWTDAKSSAVIATKGKLTIAHVNDSNNDNTYHITAKFYCDDNKYYSIDATLPMMAYDEDDNQIDLDDFYESLDDVNAKQTTNEWKKVIENGRIILMRGNEKYDLIGQKVL